MDGTIFAVILAVMVLGAVALIGIGYLYWVSYPRTFERLDKWLFRALDSGPPPYREAAQVYASMYVDAASDVYVKRQSFWASFIQFALSLVVVVFITVLLLLKIVTAEAGLPILAAFGGAAISQGINSVGGGRRSSPPPREPEPR